MKKGEGTLSSSHRAKSQKGASSCDVHATCRNFLSMLVLTVVESEKPTSAINRASTLQLSSSSASAGIVWPTEWCGCDVFLVCLIKATILLCLGANTVQVRSLSAHPVLSVGANTHLHTGCALVLGNCADEALRRTLLSYASAHAVEELHFKLLIQRRGKSEYVWVTSTTQGCTSE